MRHHRTGMLALGLLIAVAAPASSQTIRVNRALAFGNVAPAASVTVPGTVPPDARAAWLTLTLGAGRNNCKGTIRISPPTSIVRSVSPKVTVATSPFVATMVNPNNSTVNVPIGTTTQFVFSGTHQLYIGTTGTFSFARAGSYTRTLSVTFTKGTGC